MTGSNDFPTTPGAYDETWNGGRDVFLSVFDPAGAGADSLLYSTFVGGSDHDRNGRIALDGSGNVYMGGMTDEAPVFFPTTAGAYDESHNGGWDAFVSKLGVPAPPDTTPPEITPNISGTLGDNDWYVSDVTVSWTVTDLESEVTETSGCEPTVIDADTAGITLECTATSAGGTASEGVTIKRDATAPMLTIVVPQLYDVQPVGTALDFSAEDTLSGLAGSAMATLTSETGPLVMASGEEPGVGVHHTVVVEATDLAGNTVTSEPRLLVIYDPDGGFVTGGGWIMSPADACPVFCGGATGKANFGFVSKYKKGASTPTGNTEFNFKAGGLNFHSDEYDWLVVNQGGTNAQYKGQGTINGDPGPGDGYKFMLWATDGDNKNPPEDDTFRIKIWYEDGDSEIVVYDNGSHQPIGGGNIKVHKAK